MIKTISLGKRARLGLALLGCLLITSPSAAADPSGYSDLFLSHTRKYCKGKTCHYPDRLGGWGIEPKRTYSLAYDGDHAVCGKIEDALNKTIAMGPEKAAARVKMPIPAFDPSAVPKFEPVIPTYLAQNPLYSDPIFLRWKFLGGYPAIDFKNMLGIADYEPRWRRTYLPSDAYPSRWLLVPFMNDGRSYLVTAISWHNTFTIHQQPMSYFSVWNVPPEELKNKDWGRPETYSSYEPIMERWAAVAEGTENLLYTDLLSKHAKLYPHHWGYYDFQGHQQMRYPKVSMEKNQDGALKNSGGYRPEDGVQFAKIDGRYYTIFANEADDILLVVDASRPLGDDVCYLTSSISKDPRLVYNEWGQQGHKGNRDTMI